MELFFSKLSYASSKHTELCLCPCLDCATQNVKKYPSIWQIVWLCSDKEKFHTIKELCALRSGLCLLALPSGSVGSGDLNSFLHLNKNTKTRSIFLWVVSGWPPWLTGDLPIPMRQELIEGALQYLISCSWFSGSGRQLQRWVSWPGWWLLLSPTAGHLQPFCGSHIWAKTQNNL